MLATIGQKGEHLAPDSHSVIFFAPHRSFELTLLKLQMRTRGLVRIPHELSDSFQPSTGWVGGGSAKAAWNVLKDSELNA